VKALQGGVQIGVIYRTVDQDPDEAFELRPAWYADTPQYSGNSFMANRVSKSEYVSQLSTVLTDRSGAGKTRLAVKLVKSLDEVPVWARRKHILGWQRNSSHHVDFRRNS
jgi:hypothetical protein